MQGAINQGVFAMHVQMNVFDRHDATKCPQTLKKTFILTDAAHLSQHEHHNAQVWFTFSNK